MRQGRFEYWLVGVGAILVASSFAIVGGEIPVEELIAQIMLYSVFVAAVFGGKSSGLVAALLFSFGYIAIQIGFRADEVVFSWDLVQLILVRVIAFCMIGLIVGEMATRLRKRFNQSKELEGIDPVSRGYNQRLVVSALEMAIAESQRYAVPFSVTFIRVTLNPKRLPKARQRENIIRHISDSVSASTRVLDRFGRTDDGTLVLISPNTSVDQIEVMKARLEENIQGSFGEHIQELSITGLSAPEKIQDIVDYHERLKRPPHS